MDRLEEEGVVTPSDGTNRLRKVIVSEEDVPTDQELYEQG